MILQIESSETGLGCIISKVQTVIINPQYAAVWRGNPKFRLLIISCRTARRRKRKEALFSRMAFNANGTNWP